MTVPVTTMDEHAYRENNPTWHREDSAWKARKIAAVIPDSLLKHAPGRIRIADIGCGAGEILKQTAAYFRDRGCAVEAHGFDTAESALQEARKLFPQAAFHRVAAPQLLLNEVRCTAAGIGGRFDLTLMIDILEHLEDPAAFLKGISALTGHAVTHIPLEDNFEVRIRGLHSRFREQVGHLHYFNERSARALLTSNGFVIRRELPTCLDYDPDYRFASLPRRFIAQPARRLFFRRMPFLTARFLGNVSLMSFLEAHPEDHEHR